MKIRNNYVPKAKKIAVARSNSARNDNGAVAGGKKAMGVQKLQQKCPQCSQLIAVDELEKHMKIELLDPKWKEQKDRENAKKRESTLNLDNGNDVAKHLSQFASVRKDIFGTNRSWSLGMFEYYVSTY
jgi:hypothetical protein